jgi:hypothetical protein
MRTQKKKKIKGGSLNKKLRVMVLTMLVGFLVLNQNLIRRGMTNAAASPTAASLPFPDDFKKFYSSNYSYSQTMIQWKDGKFTGTGNMGFNYSHEVPGRVNIKGYYDLNVWQKACDQSQSFNGKIQTIMNYTTRYTLSNPVTIGTLNQYQMLTNLYLGDTFKGNYLKLFFLDDIMYLHGNMHQEVFDMVGYEQVTVMGYPINCSRVQWVGQLIYAGYICGIGFAPLINCSVNYYYEVKSGLLVYSDTSYLEYIHNDTSIYQQHQIYKVLTNYAYVGQPKQTETTTTGNALVNYFWSDQEARDRFNAFLIIIGIVIGGIVVVVIINKIALKRKVKFIIEYEKKFGKVEKFEDMDETKAKTLNTKKITKKTSKKKTRKKKNKKR